MKKLYTLLTAILFGTSVFATVHTVNVSNFAFSPSNLTVDVGDTIMWVWVSGNHTTTSLSVPSGALAWDEVMDSGNQIYMYEVTVEGTYNYDCTFHPVSMTGTITALAPNSIKTAATLADGLFIQSLNNGASLNVSYQLNKPTLVKVTMMDLTGKVAKILLNSNQSSGKFNTAFATEELRNGLYIVEMIAGNERYTRRVILQ